MLARRNFLSIWEDEAFDLEFTTGRIVTRKVFVCNSPDSVQFAFSLNNASFERKSPQMRHALQPLLGDGLFISDGETWRRRRRIVAPIVHVSKMSQFAPVMVEAALDMRARWLQLDGQEVDALAQSAHLTAEIICRTLFGRELGAHHAAEIVNGFDEYQSVIGQIDLMSLLGLPDWVPRYRRPAVRRSIRRIHGVLDGIIASYRGRPATAENSVIGGLLDARDEATGAPLDPIALRNEAAVLFMAGHETTANTLAWTWYLLSQAPEVEARLHAELDRVLAGRAPRLEDLPNLIYTRAVLDEVLRLYPPVPLLPREALVDETYDGHHIPKGSLVMVVPWMLHRHRKLWVKPDHFIPERFLPGSAEPVSKFAYVPFSVGPRVCAGLSFGIIEAVLTLATLAQEFQLRLRPGHVVEPVCRLTLRPDGGLPMTVRRRNAGTSSSDTAHGHAQSSCAQVGGANSKGCPFGHG